MTVGRPPAAGVARNNVRAVRLTNHEAELLDLQATYRGKKDFADYLRWLIQNDSEPSRQFRFEREAEMLRVKNRKR